VDRAGLRAPSAGNHGTVSKPLTPPDLPSRSTLRSVSLNRHSAMAACSGTTGKRLHLHLSGWLPQRLHRITAIGAGASSNSYYVQVSSLIWIHSSSELHRCYKRRREDNQANDTAKPGTHPTPWLCGQHLRPVYRPKWEPLLRRQILPLDKNRFHCYRGVRTPPTPLICDMPTGAHQQCRNPLCAGYAWANGYCKAHHGQGREQSAPPTGITLSRHNARLPARRSAPLHRNPMKSRSPSDSCAEPPTINRPVIQIFF
jgi:hypothetical protein